MSAEYSEDEKLLRDEVAHHEALLQQQELELQAIDAELEAMANARHQFDLVGRICDSLGELDDLGAGHLFWSTQDGAGSQAQHIAHARRSLEAFDQKIAGIEQRRQIVTGAIRVENYELDCLHYKVKDVVSRAERIKDEWVVEREATALPPRLLVMPWTRGLDEDKRFGRFLAGSVAASIALAMTVSAITLPLLERAEAVKLPKRIAKVVLEQRQIPQPPPQVAEAVPEPEPVKEQEQPKPKPKPEPKLVQELPPEPVDAPVVADVQQPAAREQVKTKGILAFRDSFASRANLRPTPQLGAQARVSTAGKKAVGRSQRSMVTTSAEGSSGGINLADISRDVGGGGGGQAIKGVAVSRVASSIGSGTGPDRPLSGGASAGRTDEEIQIVFDRYKSALYRLYNRELRKDPTLRGQLVLRLTIEPDGSVSLCQLKTSDMAAPTLAQRIVDRVKGFNFGAKNDIVAMTIIYPIDFLPAA